MKYLPLALLSALVAATSVQFDQTDELATAFVANGSFSGNWLVTNHTKTLYVVSMGFANEENRAKVKPYSVFPLGSNTKVFTSVAMYQLQEKGLLDLHAPIHTLLNKQDFHALGLPEDGSWCPRFNNTCQNVTTHHLLSMSSGFPDRLLCQGKDCHPVFGQDFVLYRGSISSYLRLFIRDPLDFVPGTKTNRANVNFIFAAYLIEKCSGMAFNSYLEKYIFQTANLDSTFYDPYDGQYRIIPHYVDQYYQLYTNEMLSNVTSCSRASNFIITASCRPYWNSGGINGAGGILSTIGDLARLYSNLFSNQGRSSTLLTESSIRQMIVPWQSMSHSATTYYGQGVVVEYDRDVSRLAKKEMPWPKTIQYCGGTACSHSCIAIRDNVIVATFSNNAHAIFQSKGAYDSYKKASNLSIMDLILQGSVQQTDGSALDVRNTLLNLWTS